ncbi:26S proteasome regulatory subunit 6A [Tulasnella sp. 425]|nr:26S proteasome regulatory subunit 6A [Tulasnella sp. 425]
MTGMRLIDNDVKVIRSEPPRLQHEHAAMNMKEKVRENAEKIKQAKVLPCLVANVVEVWVPGPILGVEMPLAYARRP